MQPEEPAPSFGGVQITRAQSEAEMKLIIEDLRSTDKFEQAIEKLHKYLQAHPNETLQMHLKDLSPHFATFIKTHLGTYQNGLGKSKFFS
jgi:hypothetical protein